MTRQEYSTYCQSVTTFLASTDAKDGCHSRKSEESYFSHEPCECCKRPKMAGNRLNYLFATMDGEPTAAAICEDCEYFLTYGRLCDAEMKTIETSAPPMPFDEWCYTVDIESRYEQLHGEYGDACCLSSEYKTEHYEQYVSRLKNAPDGFSVTLWE